MRKSLRFEVFKRDSFTCQYCGASAPSVVLEVDHIHPRAKGGKDQLVNLITSCQPCNSGKSDKTLDDQSAIRKQQAQLSELQERREQLEMMMRWREELDSLDSQGARAVFDYWTSLVGQVVGGYVNRRDVEKLVRRFGLQKVLWAVRTAVDKYLRFDEDGQPTQPSILDSWDRVTGILKIDERSQNDPHAQDKAYIVGILRNRFGTDLIAWRAKEVLDWAFEDGLDADSLKRLAKRAGSFHDWWCTMLDWTKG